MARKIPTERLIAWPEKRPPTALLQSIAGHLYACDGRGRPLLYLGRDSGLAKLV